MKKLGAGFPTISFNNDERESGDAHTRDELVVARKRLVHLNSYYAALNKPNRISDEQKDILEPLDALCDSNEMNGTFAELISNKQRCLELKEVSIRFSISDVLQLIHIENTRSINSTSEGAKALLEEHTLRDVILACWTGFLNLLLSKEHTPSGNAESTFGSNFSTYISGYARASDHYSTTSSDQCFDNWTSFLDILRAADQLYIRVDICSEPTSAGSIIDLTTDIESEIITLTDLLCADIQDRDETMHCFLNLIVYSISLDYSPKQNNSILKILRTLILNDCKQCNVDDNTEYDIFTYPCMETFGLVGSEIPLALLRCLVSCTPPIIKTGAYVYTRRNETKIRRLLFNESAICRDACSNDDALLRIKLAMYYLLASIVNLTLSLQLSDLCLPADLPLEAYEFLLDHGISGILFTNLNTLTMHKLSQPVSLAMYMSTQIEEKNQTKEQVNLETFYAECVKSTDSAIAKFLTQNGIEELLDDPYPALMPNSDKRNRYLRALSLLSHRENRSFDNQDTYPSSSQVSLNQTLDVTTVRCVPSTECSADELSMLDERVPAKRGALLCGILEPHMVYSIATSLSYFLIPCDVEKLNHFPTRLIIIETLSNMCGLVSPTNKELHNFKLQVLCYAPFSHVTRIVDSDHERLKFMRMIFSLYSDQSSGPEIGAPANKNLAECCLSALKCCLKDYQKGGPNLIYKPKMNSHNEIFNIVLDPGLGSVHAIVALTLIILLEMGFVTSMSVDLTKLSLLKNDRESQEYIEKYLSQIMLFPYIKKIILSIHLTVLHLDNSSRKLVVLDDDDNERLYVAKSQGARRNFKR